MPTNFATSRAFVAIDRHTVKNAVSNARAGGNQQAGFSNGTDTGCMTRSYHVNESKIPMYYVQPVYNGWALNSNSQTVADAICPNNYFVTCGIEYPAGSTRTQVIFGGSPQGTVVAGSNLVADRTYLPTAIPAGAGFWVWTYTTAPAAGKWPICGNTWSGLGEMSASGTSLSDVTIYGTFTSTGASCNRPAAILSSGAGFNPMSLAVKGDSIVAGSGDGNPDANGNTGPFARAATGIAPCISIAVPGTTALMSANTNGMQYQAPFMALCGVTHCINDLSVNDLGTGSSAATISGYQQMIWNNIAAVGVKAGQSTLTPIAASTDGWLTVTNQSVTATGFTGGASSVKASINANTRTLPTNLTFYVETGDAAETARNSGIFIAGAAYNAAHLAPTDSWTAAAGSTTTVINSNNTRPTNYYNYGGALYWTSGANAGVISTVASSVNAGAITLNSALANAPAAGDTFNAIPFQARFTGDGTHPAYTGNTTGGTLILRDVVIPVLNTLNV